MHRRSLLTTPLAAAAAQTNKAQSSKQNSTAATRIRATLAAQQDAWNRGDIDAFMTAYWNSPELAFIGDTIARGWQATIERYRRRYPTRAAMGTLTFSAIEVHEVGAEAAWVYGRFALARTKEGGGPANGKFTLVLHRVQGEWKIVLDHTSS
jgi:ketosteroid isomerase-like protein